MKLYEVLDLISKRQKIEIRMIFLNGFGSGKQICEGSPDTLDQSVFRFLNFNEVIGLGAFDDVLVIYIDQETQK